MSPIFAWFDADPHHRIFRRTYGVTVWCQARPDRWATYYARPATDVEATAQAQQRFSLLLATPAGMVPTSTAISGGPAGWRRGRRCSPA